jgi:hypothetical protein
MTGFLDFMKYMGTPEAADLGKKASGFTDEVITLLTDIRDELRAARLAREESNDGK